MYISQTSNLILVWPLCGLSSFDQSHRSVSAKTSFCLLLLVYQLLQMFLMELLFSSPNYTFLKCKRQWFYSGQETCKLQMCWPLVPSSNHQNESWILLGSQQAKWHQHPVTFSIWTMLGMLKQNKVRYIPTWNWTFWLGIVLDHCTVYTCANDIILTADW